MAKFMNKVIKIIPVSLGITLVQLWWALLNPEFTLFFSIVWGIIAFTLAMTVGITILMIKRIYYDSKDKKYG